MNKSKDLALIVISLIYACGCEPGTEKIQPATYTPEIEARIAAISQQYVFADMHSHPSRFHRANVETIAADEIGLYRSNYMNLVVANISSDMAYSGGYTMRGGTEIERGRFKPEPGEAFSLAADRLGRLQRTFELGIAVQADNPADVLEANGTDAVAVLPALEGGDALEGQIDNLHKLHEMGLRLIQLVHFRANEIGHIQTYPYSPGGLTTFGREVVGEANRLGIVIDLAHANNETILDVLELSTDPVIFSHGGLQAIHEQDRALSDEEVRAIAGAGGIVGIWPNGASIPDVATLVDHVDHVIGLVGIDHVGLGSDLRGMSSYSEGFDSTAEFRGIAAELIARGYSDESIGKIMGGNFFRLWQNVADPYAEF